MAEYTFTDNEGKKFTVKGPESLTEAQAREIFNKQSSTGALVGLKPGDILNSAKQALGGVTGAIGSALGSLTSGISNPIAGITKALSSSAPTNPINLGNLAQSPQGLVPMAGIPTQAVTAGLSSVSKIIDQPTSVLSNDKGLGCFGLNVKQLETTGYVKPGTSNFLNTPGVSTVSVLKSPAVWTGKDSITSSSAMLSNPSLQSLTQQNLMSTGLQGVSTLGVPVNNLDPQAAVGVALNAAKSIPDAAQWAKGAALPAEVKTTFDQTAIAGAFGVNLSDLKANNAMLEEETISGSTKTVDRTTLNAATQRILGDAKIPKLTYRE